MTSITTTSSRTDAPDVVVPVIPPTQYDDVADAYDLLIRPKYEPIAAHVARAVEAVADLRSAVVLELSAGTGTLTHLLAPRVRNYVATDISGPMLDVAKRRGGEGITRVAWTRAAVEDVPLPGRLADVLVSSLGPVQDTLAALAEARRMLVPGGRLIACTWGDDYAELALLQEARRLLGVEPRPVTTTGDVAARVDAAGFREVTVTPFRLPVVHESLATYLAYRGAFGAVPLPAGLTPDRALEALAAAAATYLDEGGRVVLDWHLLLVSGTA